LSLVFRLAVIGLHLVFGSWNLPAFDHYSLYCDGEPFAVAKTFISTQLGVTGYWLWFQ